MDILENARKLDLGIGNNNAKLKIVADSMMGIANALGSDKTDEAIAKLALLCEKVIASNAALMNSVDSLVQSGGQKNDKELASAISSFASEIKKQNTKVSSLLSGRQSGYLVEVMSRDANGLFKQVSITPN